MLHPWLKKRPRRRKVWPAWWFLKGVSKLEDSILRTKSSGRVPKLRFLESFLYTTTTWEPIFQVGLSWILLIYASNPCIGIRYCISKFNSLISKRLMMFVLCQWESIHARLVCNIGWGILVSIDTKVSILICRQNTQPYRRTVLPSQSASHLPRPWLKKAISIKKIWIEPFLRRKVRWTS